MAPGVLVVCHHDVVVTIVHGGPIEKKRRSVNFCNSYRSSFSLFSWFHIFSYIDGIYVSDTTRDRLAWPVVGMTEPSTVAF